MKNTLLLAVFCFLAFSSKGQDCPPKIIYLVVDWSPSMRDYYDSVLNVATIIADTSFTHDGQHGGALYQWIFFADYPQFFSLSNNHLPPSREEVNVGDGTFYGEVFYELNLEIDSHQKEYPYHQKIILFFSDGISSDFIEVWAKYLGEVKKKSDIYVFPIGKDVYPIDLCVIDPQVCVTEGLVRSFISYEENLGRVITQILCR